MSLSKRYAFFKISVTTEPVASLSVTPRTFASVGAWFSILPFVSTTFEANEGPFAMKGGSGPRFGSWPCVAFPER